jgi:hypothetical protein
MFVFVCSRIRGVFSSLVILNAFQFCYLCFLSFTAIFMFLPLAAMGQPLFAVCICVLECRGLGFDSIFLNGQPMSLCKFDFKNMFNCVS